MYREEHFDDVLKLYAAAFSSTPLNYNFITPEKSERYIRSIINTPGFLGYTFWNGEIVAFVFGVLDDYFEGVLFSISEFAVSPAFQRKGVGSEVLQMLEEKLSHSGVDAVNLHTSTHLPAYGFYKKNGYEEVVENVSFMKWLGS